MFVFGMIIARERVPASVRSNRDATNMSKNEVLRCRVFTSLFIRVFSFRSVINIMNVCENSKCLNKKCRFLMFIRI